MLRTLLQNLQDTGLVREAASAAFTIGWLGRGSGGLDDVGLLCRALRLSNRPPLRPRLMEALRRRLTTARLIGKDVRPVGDNALWRSYVTSPEARGIRERFRAYGAESMTRLRFPVAGEGGDHTREGDLIILKPPDRDERERGVLLIKYTEAIRRFAAVYDLSRLAAHYRLVLEPSFWGYEDPTFLMYLGRDLDVVVQCGWRRDREFIESLGSNLVPCELGAGDWVDLEAFAPTPDESPRSARPIDVTMVSSWHPFKRHSDLFRAIPAIERRMGRRLNVCLVGYDAGWDRAWLLAQARRARVSDRLDIREDISHPEVARILRQSRCYLLLSRGEGANKALFEALAADTPVVFFAHHRGVPVDRLPPSVGMRFRSTSELVETVAATVEACDGFRPRVWIVEESGWCRSTARLDEVLRTLATRAGEPWTVSITPKTNAPNLRYAREPDWDRRAAYRRLGDFLYARD